MKKVGNHAIEYEEVEFGCRFLNTENGNDVDIWLDDEAQAQFYCEMVGGSLIARSIYTTEAYEVIPGE